MFRGFYIVDKNVLSTMQMFLYIVDWIILYYDGIETGHITLLMPYSAIQQLTYWPYSGCCIYVVMYVCISG